MSAEGRTEPRRPASATHGTFWAYAQNWAARGITLLVFFALARLLTPTEFGAFAVTMVFLALGEIFVEQLYAHSIVQREELTPAHLDAAFWATVFFGLLMALVTVLGAGFFAKWFDAPGIAPVIMAIAPAFVLMALSSVPAGLLRRTLDYRTLARRTALSNLSSGVLAIISAFAGLGVWAFVVQLLCFHLVGTWVLWRHERWRPNWRFSLRALRELSGFSASMTFIRLLDLVDTRVVELAIGTRLGLLTLGNYALATRASQAATQLLAAPLWESSIGAFARQQSDPAALKELLQQRALLAATFIAPIFMFSAATGERLIPAVFGAKWNDAVPAFQVLCLLGVIRSVSFLYGGMLQAIGAAGMSVRIAVVRSAVTLGFLPLLMPHGLAGVASCLLVAQIAVLPMVFFVIRSKLELNPLLLIRNIAKPFFAAVCAAVLGWYTANALGGRVPDAVGATVSLLACVLSFAALLVFLMPTRLMLAARKLPPRLGRLPGTWLVRMIRLQDSIRVFACLLLMRTASSRRPADPASRGSVVVVFPDAYSIDGSLGDQALLGGLMSIFESADIRTARALCRPGVPVPHSPQVVLERLPLWGNLRQARRLGRELTCASAFVIVGADVLDGFYSRFESVLRLRMAGFCAERGVPALICSFSFNGAPDPVAADTLKRMPHKVTLLCRDAVSRERVARLAGEGVQLTADLAYLLKPSPQSALEETVSAWLAKRRASGQGVIGWNISPHSLKLLSSDQHQDALKACAEVIGRLVRERGVLVVLMPHDFRDDASDPQMLMNLWNLIDPALRDKVLEPQGPYRASDVKQCCAHFDLVVTGRMHLMIAALGREVPVLAVEYQGKFAGALKHFGLGPEHLLTPAEMSDGDRLHQTIVASLEKLAQTRSQIALRRPAVVDLASSAIKRFWKEARAS